MSPFKESKFYKMFYSNFLSPEWYISRAVIIIILYLFFHFLGLREYTSIICGTSPTDYMGRIFPVTMGVMYGMAYFAFVTLAPIFFISAILLFVFQKVKKQ